MRKYIKALIIVLLISAPLSVSVKAESLIDINELIENAKELDGQEVTIQGEAIGESMNRGDYSWININDGTNAIGIWLKKSDADKVLRYGNYKYIGDIVKITGVFHRACVEHGGEADLHSNSLEIVKNGYQVKETIASEKVISAIVLIPCALFMLILFFKRKKAKRTL
ncbi:MAG: hypothetical protein K0S01_3139 [Herbinix sp.]|jgi:hypothetical protein|nr:hypothetical protein [Herbinix sp.]